MNQRLTLSAVIISTALLSTEAFAHDRDGWREYRHHHRQHYSHQGWRAVPPQVVYVPPRPVYVRPPVAYYPPEYHPSAYYPTPVYVSPPVRYAPARVYYGGDRMAGQVVGAIAGGVIGNAIGQGGFAPTAIGAVMGGIVGGQLAD